jgi:hypothetical protein
MRKLRPADPIRPPVKQFIAELVAKGVSRQMAKDQYNNIDSYEFWKNELYTVMIKPYLNNGFGEEMVYLSIRRNDREPCRNWRHIQSIKNQLVGPECEGMELYPAESRVADCANQYHLFVFKNPEIKIPVGFADGARSEDSICGSRNEPFEVCAHCGQRNIGGTQCCKDWDGKTVMP